MVASVHPETSFTPVTLSGLEISEACSFYVINTEEVMMVHFHHNMQ